MSLEHLLAFSINFIKKLIQIKREFSARLELGIFEFQSYLFTTRPIP